MATLRAYYGQDRDREYFERIFQSANINFILGSGASLPAINVLGSIESELETLVRAGDDSQYFSKSASFLQTVWRANNALLGRNTPGKKWLPPFVEKVEATQKNYMNFIRALETLLTRRRTGLLPRRINLFTTNYDLFTEDAAVKNNNIILNDGFRQRGDLYGRMIFDPKSFYQTIQATGNLYNYSVEIPTVNLIKIHGSFSWKHSGNDIYYVIQDMKSGQFDSLQEEREWVSSHQLVLPRKDKFRETVLDNVYYNCYVPTPMSWIKKAHCLLFSGSPLPMSILKPLRKKHCVMRR